MKKKVSELKSFDVLDYIKDEEYAGHYLEAAAWESDPGWVDHAWEDIKRASARHNFAITPTLQDTYAAARAAACVAAEPALA